MYKIGDRVRFTFLGEAFKGVIIDKVDKLKWKVECDDGTVYPFVHGKEPKLKKGEKPLSVMLKKL